MAESRNESTRTFPIQTEKEQEMHYVLRTVYEALMEKGYNPINQIVGYILSEDPTYITNYKNARSLICRLDRDELLNALVKTYLGC
ncbi:MAG: IreB family regulatory phosphoprotein [Clostridia bacterium]|nr:IreB family regulatory phosphoprotein [Clostridia bacterium]